MKTLSLIALICSIVGYRRVKLDTKKEKPCSPQAQWFYDENGNLIRP